MNLLTTLLAQSGHTTDGEPVAKPETLIDFLLNFEVLGVDVWRLALAVVIITIGFALRGYLFDKMMSPIRALFEKTATNLDNLVLDKTKAPFAWFIRMLSIYLGLRILNLPQSVLQSLDLGAKTLGTLLVAWILFRIVDVLVEALSEFTEKTDSQIDDQLVPVVRRILRFFLVTLAIFFVIQQWGYNVSSLIAGLGIGGLAFALAARNMLSNWFGALMIFTDHPFKVGEWVEVDEGEGEVEEVGLRSTRIRTYGRNRIVVPNAEMASQTIINKSARDRRRIKADIGLVYDTTHAQMQEILENLRALLDQHEVVWDGDWRVYFVEFGENALELELSCFTEGPDITVWRETREEILLEIIRIVEEAGSAFAYPTRTIQLDQTTPEKTPEFAQPMAKSE